MRHRWRAGASSKDLVRVYDAIRASRLSGDHPIVRRLVQALERGRFDERCMRWLSWVEQQGLTHACSGGAPFSVAPHDLVSGGVVLGTSTNMVQDGGPVGLALGKLCQHSGVYGQTGSGKSWFMLDFAHQCVQLGVPVWWFDRTGDGKRLISTLGVGDVRFVDPSWLRIAPFQPPRSEHRWRATIVELLTSMYYGRSGAEMVLSIAILELHKGLLAGGGERVWPTSKEVEEEIKDRHPKKWSRSAGYYESALRVVHSMRDGLPGTVDAVESLPLDVLARTSCVFDVSQLSVTSYLFLVMLLLESTSQEGNSMELPRMVILDEAAEVFNEHQVRRQDRGHPPQHAIPRRFRARNIGLVIGEQSPSLLPRDVLGNLGTTVAFKLTHERCRREVGMSLGLGKDEWEYLNSLPARHAVVRTVDGDRAYLVRVPILEFLSPPSQSVLLASRDSMMEGLLPIRSGEKEAVVEEKRVEVGNLLKEQNVESDGERLAWRVFDSIALRLELSIGERCEVLGVDRPSEWRARRWLTSQGLIVEAGKVGRHQFYWLSHKGIGLAGERGLDVGAWKSGSLHEVVVRRVEAALEKEMDGVGGVGGGGGDKEGGVVGVCRRGIVVRGVQVDSVFTSRGGVCVAVQVSHTNKAGKEVEAALQIAGADSVDGVALVGVGKRKAGALERELERVAGDVGVVEVVGLFVGSDCAPCGASSWHSLASKKIGVMSADKVLRGTSNWKGWIEGMVCNGEADEEAGITEKESGGGV